ncbi:MAG TPA: 50S ribosomal protein L29 [Bdellovibrionota bacterium]|nr:50S ribosomal protein L29 [Bdellovibrionota bacterium]
MKGKEHRKEQIANLRALKTEELEAKVREANEQLFWLHFKRHSEQATTPMNMRKFRQLVSRIKTIQQEMVVSGKTKKEKQA